MRPRLVRYYGPDYDNLKHGYVYQVHCLYSHGFMLIDDHHEQAYVYAGNCEVLHIPRLTGVDLYRVEFQIFMLQIRVLQN